MRFFYFLEDILFFFIFIRFFKAGCNVEVADYNRAVVK